VSGPALEPAALVLNAPRELAFVALNGVHDAQIRLGDLVAVFGLGTPGQIVVQAARASGATVIGVDPVKERREMALRLGADRVLDPNAGAADEGREVSL